MSISSNIIINDENILENIAIVLNAMKEKYKTEINEFILKILIH